MNYLIPIFAGVGFFLIGCAIVYGIATFARKHEEKIVWMDDQETHAPESELCRHATSIWIGGNHFDI
jgi:hypothetical protein